MAALPRWANELMSLYGCDAANQFILYGNVNDRAVLPLGATTPLETTALLEVGDGAVVELLLAAVELRGVPAGPGGQPGLFRRAARQ